MRKLAAVIATIVLVVAACVIQFGHDLKAGLVVGFIGLVALAAAHIE